jgi:hypothetical protein
MRLRRVTAESRHPRSLITAAPPSAPQLVEQRQEPPRPGGPPFDRDFVTACLDPFFWFFRRGHAAAP